MQLVAYGAQDIYLTGNPMITYFKVVYRRHTNFAMESIEQTFSGTVGFGKKVTALISRNGDLVNGMVLEATIPEVTVTGSATNTPNPDTNLVNNGRWVDKLGHYLISQVDVEIGGQCIDRHYGDWLEIWSQLSVSQSQKRGYNTMIGHDYIGETQLSGGLQSLVQVQEAAGAGPAASAELQMGNVLDANGNRKLYIPLQFWFCRNVGLALPLIALQYHEVKVSVTFAESSTLLCADNNPPDLTAANGDKWQGNDVGVGADVALTYQNDGLAVNAGQNLSAKLWVDYIYLDTDERRRFAQVSHEYLIEQLQFTGNASYSGENANITLTFNHPVKELIWVARSDVSTAQKQWANYTTNWAAGTESQVNPPSDAVAGIPANDDARCVLTENLVKTAKLQLNGHDRFATRDGSYFNLTQTQCHTSTPESPGINVYSFALKPEDHQPSGTCNFSRIDNAKLVLKMHSHNDGEGAADGPSGIIKVFATNYNVLRVMSGMGGLAYSN